MAAPLTFEEQEILQTVNFQQRKRRRTKAELELQDSGAASKESRKRKAEGKPKEGKQKVQEPGPSKQEEGPVQFEYQPGFGPPDAKRRLSSWYPTKEQAARAIWQWAGPEWPDRIKCKASSSGAVNKTLLQEDQLSAAIRKLRQKLVELLEKEVPKHDQLHQHELLEDDELATAVAAGIEQGHPIADALSLAFKVETDVWEGPTVSIGNRGLQMLMTALGLSFGITTVEEIKRQERLPSPLCLVYHHFHWVPMWQQDFAGPYNSRPWIPKEAYEGFEDPFKEAAHAAKAHMDITCRAAGDCGFHSLLILQDLLVKHGLQPVGQSGTVPRSRALLVAASHSAICNASWLIQGWSLQIPGCSNVDR